MATSTITYRTDIERRLQRVLKKLEGEGTELDFAIGVKGDHSYWWILEYGSTPKEKNQGWYKDDRVKLEPPAEARGAGFFGKHTQWYPISPKSRGYTRPFHGRGPRRTRTPFGQTRPQLKFFHGGKWVFAWHTTHPGIKARLFIQKVIARNLDTLLDNLKNLFKGGRAGSGYGNTQVIPDREDFLEVVNNTAEQILKELQVHTPVEEPPPPDENDPEAPEPPDDHLVDAWFIRKAR